MIYQYYPIASCRMGALWTLSDIADSCIVEFGPAGTTHFSIEGMSNLNAEPPSHGYTTHISERDLTFGDTSRLEKALMEVDQHQNPQHIFVMGSTLSSIIGTDIESVCMMMESKVKAKLIPVKSDGFRGDFTYGIEEVLMLLAAHVVRPVKEADKKPLSYTLVGTTMDVYSGRSDMRAIKELLYNLYGATCHTVFTDGSAVERIATAATATVQIAMRKEAHKACLWMEKKYNVPYVTALPYGLGGIEAFCAEIESKTGWVRNQTYYQTEVTKLKGVVRRVTEHLKAFGPLRAMVSGNIDTVLGVNKVLSEFGISESVGLVNHKVKDCPEGIYDQATETVKHEVLKNNPPHFILGDAVLIEFAKCRSTSVRWTHQISNPNLDQVNISHQKPLMGIEGIRYIGEWLLNI